MPKASWFQEKVKNEITMASWNGLHKLPIAISGKTPKPLSVFELRRQNDQVMEYNIKKSSEHVWEPEKWMVISS